MKKKLKKKNNRQIIKSNTIFEAYIPNLSIKNLKKKIIV